MFGSHFEWRLCCGPTPDRFWEKFNLSTVTDRQQELGRPKSGKAIIVIVSPLVALMDDQVKKAAKLGLCAAQLGVHNDPEIMEGNFSLIFGSPKSWILNPKWRAMLASTLYKDNLIAIVVDEAHIAYKW